MFVDKFIARDESSSIPGSGEVRLGEILTKERLPSESYSAGDSDLIVKNRVWRRGGLSLRA